MNCSYVIRSIHRGQRCFRLLAFATGAHQHVPLSYLSLRQFLQSYLLTLLNIRLQTLFKSTDDAVHVILY